MCGLRLRDFEMWRVAVASVVSDYPMVSVRMLAGNLGFMLPTAGGISSGFWAHGKLSIGNAPFVHKFYTCAG